MILLVLAGIFVALAIGSGIYFLYGLIKHLLLMRGRK